MSTIDVSDADFNQKILQSSKPVLVDFWAPWCGPCKLAEPVVEEIAEDYKDRLVVGKVNVDKNQALSQKYGVISIPTMVLFKDGKEVARQSGFSGKEAIVKLLDKIEL